MSGTSVIGLKGTLDITTTRRDDSLTLQQTISGIEVKTYEFTVPHGGSVVTLPLPFSAGVTEALQVVLYVPRPIRALLTSTDATTGPVGLLMMGHQMLTVAPGGGISQIQLQNNDPTVDVTIQVIIGCKAQATDPTPEFFTASL